MGYGCSGMVFLYIAQYDVWAMHEATRLNYSFSQEYRIDLYGVDIANTKDTSTKYKPYHPICYSFYIKK